MKRHHPCKASYWACRGKSSTTYLIIPRIPDSLFVYLTVYPRQFVLCGRRDLWCTTRSKFGLLLLFSIFSQLSGALYGQSVNSTDSLSDHNIWFVMLRNDLISNYPWL